MLLRSKHTDHITSHLLGTQELTEAVVLVATVDRRELHRRQILAVSLAVQLGPQLALFAPLSRQSLVLTQLQRRILHDNKQKNKNHTSLLLVWLQILQWRSHKDNRNWIIPAFNRNTYIYSRYACFIKMIYIIYESCVSHDWAFAPLLCCTT